MNIIHIIPGSGGSFYCGNCLRDSKYFETIRSQGHNIIKVPMYLPLFANDEVNNMPTPVFYGAISLYLKQVFPIFRKAPNWFDNFLNSKPLLKLASKKANSTRAKGLEEMTLSMLLGEHGNQKNELEKMVQWLSENFKADVIHISNALLLGLVHKLKERLKAPVVCSLQDEDVWVDVMQPEFAGQVWALMKGKARDIDVFVSVSKYYSDFMKSRLQLQDEKLRTLHLGVDPADYHYINSRVKKRNIGFLSRLCYSNGLDILVDAFLILKQKPKFNDVNLLLTGGYTTDDTKFIKFQEQKIINHGLSGSVEIIKDFDRSRRNDFFDQVMVLSVPVRNGEAFGIYLTEAMAKGVPIVQPALGAFPEIVEKSGGGLTFAENKPEQLAEVLENLLDDTEKLQELSQKARRSIEDNFNINVLSQKMIGIYQEVINNYKSS